ncbi:MAG TPA: hypothetical protein V6D20_17845 [Candidatus Obscuribacterales bacterium]
MSIPILDSLDLQQNAIIAALMNPTPADPGTPEEGQIWFRTDLNRLRIYAGGAIKSLAFTTDAGAGAVNATDFDAFTILAADADDSPLPLTIPASTLVGRQAAGGIDALTAAEVRTILGIEAGATADQTASEVLSLLLTVDGTTSGLDADLLDGQEGSFYATAASVAGVVNEADYNASTILAADADDTPLPLTIAASTIVGRKAAGGISAMSAAEVRTILGVEAGATADQTAAEILASLLTVDGAASSLDADLLDGQQGTFYATAASVVGVVYEADFGASTILAADTDDTPLPLTIPASTIVGRKATGGISAMSATEVRTVLGVEAGATADQTAAEILSALLTVDGAASSLDADLLDGQEGSFYATAASVVGLASEDYVDTEINNLIAAAPGTLDTLNELAAALGDDPNFATTITNSLATKPTKYAVDIGDGVATVITVTHSLGTYDVIVELYFTATKKSLMASVTRTTINALEVTFASPPASGSIRCVVHG